MSDGAREAGRLWRHHGDRIASSMQIPTCLAIQMASR
jgi:hypothetical protein